MTRVAALALLVALLALPSAHAAAPPSVPFPAELQALLPAWMDDATQAQERAEGRPWAAEAARFLDAARQAASEGRVRSTLHDLQTHAQILEANLLLDEIAGEGTDGARKSRVLARADAWRGASLADWESYRAALHALDGEMESARAVEAALLSADVALSAAVRAVEFQELRASFTREGGVDEGLLGALVLHTRVVSHDLRLARDLLDAAASMEGVAPRLDPAKWGPLVNSTLIPIDPNDVIAPLQAWERAAGTSRANGEGLLAMALHLAEVRELRLAEISQVYSEAASRGRDVLNDSVTGLTRGMENVTAEDALARGLAALHTADALDAGRHVLGLMPDGVTIEAVMHAWARLHQQGAANAILLEALPAAPAEAPRDAPAPGAFLILGTVAAAALLLRTPRR